MASEAERYLVIDGRRWRRTDPAIPKPFAAELTAELMSARRAVAAAKRTGSAPALREARRRVQDAKVALGERGSPWWVAWPEREAVAQAQRTAAAMRALLRHRGRGKTICPSDVARAVAGSHWRAAMARVRAVACELVARGEVTVRQKGRTVDPERARGPIRISAPA